MMTTGKIVAVMLTACVALILSHPATLAQAPDRQAVHRFANVVDLTHALDEYPLRSRGSLSGSAWHAPPSGLKTSTS